MSKEEVAEQIGEQNLGHKANSVFGLIMAMGVKYGLPSLCCAWLFYVIWCKDQIIYSMAKETTMALVESNRSQSENSSAIKQLAVAVDGLGRDYRNK